MNRVNELLGRISRSDNNKKTDLTPAEITIIS